MKFLLTILVFIIIFIYSNNLSADNFYQYTDENGKVWFSNFCPKRRKCTLILKGKGKKENSVQSQSSKKSDIKEKNNSKGSIPANSEDRLSLYESYIEEASRLYQIPQNLIKAVMKVESNFHPYAISWAGAQGLMQLMPATAAFLQVLDPFEPRDNIIGGTKYLRILANKFSGDMIKTLAGYHAGEGLVNRADGVPSRTTADYVLMVLREYRKFKEIYPEEK